MRYLPGPGRWVIGRRCRWGRKRFGSGTWAIHRIVRCHIRAFGSTFARGLFPLWIVPRNQPTPQLINILHDPSNPRQPILALDDPPIQYIIPQRRRLQPRIRTPQPRNRVDPTPIPPMRALELAHLRRRRDSVHVWHGDIGEDEVGVERVEGRDGFEAVRRLRGLDRDFLGHFAEEGEEDLAADVVVIDDEDAQGFVRG